MAIKVKVFAVLKEIFGWDEFDLQVSENVSCQDVFTLLKNEYGEKLAILEHSLIAVNGKYAGPHSKLLAGDELAILPPVSGG